MVRIPHQECIIQNMNNDTKTDLADNEWTFKDIHDMTK